MSRPKMLKDQNYNSIPVFGMRQCFSKTMGTGASPAQIFFGPADNTGYADPDEDGGLLLMEPNQCYEFSFTKLAGATTNNSLINFYLGFINGTYVVNPIKFAIFSGTLYLPVKFGPDNDRCMIERVGAVLDDVQVALRKLS